MKKPKLKTLPIEERYRDYYNTIEIGYAWITGFRPYYYWVNTTQCFDRITNATYTEWDDYQSNMTVAEAENNRFVKANLTTALIQNFSVTGWYCNSAWTSMSRYWETNYD